MLAGDVMTTEVTTVAPDTSIQAVAAVLSEKGISGVPVVDAADRMVGIVSEGDLIHRTEIGTDRRNGKRRSWWLDVIGADREREIRDYIKSHARTAEDVMTRDVVWVTDVTPLAEVATLLETKKIKRVPVIRDGKLVGIISRANLVRALAATKNETPTGEASDEAIRRNLLAEIAKQKWIRIFAEDVIVKNGTVYLWFSSDQSPEERQAVRVAANNIPGVKGVEEHIVLSPMVMPA